MKWMKAKHDPWICGRNWNPKNLYKDDFLIIFFCLSFQTPRRVSLESILIRLTKKLNSYPIIVNVSVIFFCLWWERWFNSYLISKTFTNNGPTCMITCRRFSYDWKETIQRTLINRPKKVSVTGNTRPYEAGGHSLPLSDEGRR